MMNQYNAERMTNEAAAQTRYQPVGGAMLGSMADVPERCLPVIKDRVAEATARACDLAARLEIIGDRVFGGRPIGNNAKDEASACSGEVGGINDALDALSAQIARAHDAMTRLESL